MGERGRLGAYLGNTGRKGGLYRHPLAKGGGRRGSETRWDGLVKSEEGRDSHHVKGRLQERQNETQHNVT